MIKLGWTIFLTVLTLTGCWFFKSKVNVEPGISRSSSDPFGTIFTLTNEGQLSLYSVDVKSRLENLQLSNGSKLSASTTFDPKHHFEELKAGQRSSIVIMGPVDAGIEFPKDAALMLAEVASVISYRNCFGHRSEDKFYFRLIKDEDGKGRWIRIASR